MSEKRKFLVSSFQSKNGKRLKLLQRYDLRSSKKTNNDFIIDLVRLALFYVKTETLKHFPQCYWERIS